MILLLISDQQEIITMILKLVIRYHHLKNLETDFGLIAIFFWQLLKKDLAEAFDHFLSYEEKCQLMLQPYLEKKIVKEDKSAAIKVDLARVHNHYAQYPDGYFLMIVLKALQQANRRTYTFSEIRVPNSFEWFMTHLIPLKY